MKELIKIYTDTNGVVVHAVSDDEIPYTSGHVYEIEGLPAPEALTVRFQQGPVKECGVNGVTSEALLAIVVDRLQILDGLFPCDDNKKALQHLLSALTALENRTKKRIVQGVEGTNINHI